MGRSRVLKEDVPTVEQIEKVCITKTGTRQQGVCQKLQTGGVVGGGATNVWRSYVVTTLCRQREGTMSPCPPPDPVLILLGVL